MLASSACVSRPCTSLICVGEYDTKRPVAIVEVTGPKSTGLCPQVAKIAPVPMHSNIARTAATGRIDFSQQEPFQASICRCQRMHLTLLQECRCFSVSRAMVVY